MSQSTPAPMSPFRGSGGTRGSSGRYQRTVIPDETGKASRHRVIYTIPPDPYFLAHTRTFTRDTLRRWRLPVETVDVAEAVVSELATNAVVHTGATARLRLILDRLLRIEVTDASHTPPRPCAAPR